MLHCYRASAGTGKTYTLTHHYVDLLMQGVSYRAILAVTFTNKATAEMKERILTLLWNKAQDEHDPQKARSAVLFRQILSDFDNMRVMTIDAFLQLLLRRLARMLGKAAGYSVELDTKPSLPPWIRFYPPT